MSTAAIFQTTSRPPLPTHRRYWGVEVVCHCCENRNMTASVTCPRCQSVFYCSERCMKQHRKHKKSGECFELASRNKLVSKKMAVRRCYVHTQRWPSSEVMAPRVFEQSGLCRSHDIREASLLWWHAFPSAEILRELPSGAFVNHYPRSTIISHKHRLAKVMHGTGHVPRTFCYPADFPPSGFLSFEEVAGCHPTSLWIVKEAVGGEGVGTRLLRAEGGTRAIQAGELCVACVIQEYLARPLLHCSHKLDLRVFVAVTGDFAKVYAYREGVVRFAPRPYSLAEVVRRPPQAVCFDCHPDPSRCW